MTPQSHEFDYVTISKPIHKRKTVLDEAIEDVKAGHVTHYDSVEVFYKDVES